MLRLHSLHMAPIRVKVFDMPQPALWATSDEADVAAPARTLIRWLLTIGAAILYAVLVFKVGLDIWIGSDPVTVDKIIGGVMNSLAITFGSAFVGWFGVTTTKANVHVKTGSSGWNRRWAILGQLLTDLAGAAVFAMESRISSTKAPPQPCLLRSRRRGRPKRARLWQRRWRLS
jgi:hypothetical protein